MFYFLHASVVKQKIKGDTLQMAVLESHCAKRESIGKNIMRACYSHVTGPLSFLNMSQTCHERLSKGKEAEIKGGKRNLRRH